MLSVEGDSVLIDVGLKSEGRVALREFSTPGQRAEIQAGDRVDVYLERMEDRNGEAVLSRERARREEAWTQLEKAFRDTERVSGTIFGRVKALFPRARVLGPQHILGATDQQLRGAGLSRSKQLSLRDLARRTAAGELPTLAQIQRMDDEAIVERLTGKPQVYTYSDHHRVGDHICYYSDLTKMRTHYPEWDITITLEETVQQIAEAWSARAATQCV